MRRTNTHLLGSAAYAVLLCLLFSSCASKRAIVTTQDSKRDSTHVLVTDIERVSHDTTYIVEPDSAALRALILCDSLGNAYLAELSTEHGARIKAELELERARNGHGMSVRVDCKEDSLRVIVTKQRETINMLKSELVSSHESESTQKPVVVAPDWAYAYRKGFWVLLIILLAELAVAVAYVVGSKTTWGKSILTALKLFFRWR